MVLTGADLSNKFASNVAVISSNGPIGNNVMTCAWIVRVSNNPLMVAIAIGKDRASYNNIKKSKEFGASICSTEQNVLASIAGSCSGKDVDKIKVLEELGFKFYKAKKINVLMIEDCCLNMECKVINEIPAGDHVIFVGEVVEGKSNDKLPILYNLGKYFGVGQQVMKPNQEDLDRINSLVEKNKRS